MGEETKKVKDIDIISKRFEGVKSGYSTIQVDTFLDELLRERNLKNSTISDLEAKIAALNNDNQLIREKLQEVSNQFNQFKVQYKNIKPSDFVDNPTRIDDIKKINAYEKKLKELGVDPKTLL